MNDVDELLRADARRWNREQPVAPDLDAAVSAVATSSARRRHRTGRGQVAGTVGAVLAVAATVIAAVLITHHRTSGTSPNQTAQRIEAPTSIVVAGKTIPYAGGVPWAGAVIASPDSTSLTVAADGDAIVTKKFVCGLPQERVYVHESSTTVTVLVAGYAEPLPAKYACAAVGHEPQLNRITLNRPLGSRGLIDATGAKRHDVLVASTVPAPRVPTGYTARPLQWDEQTGLATRIYSTPAMVETIQLGYGTANTLADPGGGFSRVASVRIAAASATVWRNNDARIDMTTVIWSLGQHRLELTVQGDPQRHLSVAAAIALARTVR